MTSFNNVISILGNCSCCCNLKRPKAYSFDEKDLNDTEQNIRNKKRRNVSLKLQLRSSRSHRQYDWGNHCPCLFQHQPLGLLKRLQSCSSAFLLFFSALVLFLLHSLGFSVWDSDVCCSDFPLLILSSGWLPTVFLFSFLNICRFYCWVTGPPLEGVSATGSHSSLNDLCHAYVRRVTSGWV